MMNSLTSGSTSKSFCDARLQMFPVIVLMTPVLLFSSCAPGKLDRSELNLTGHDGSLRLIRSVSFDEKGLPQFDDPLTERPDDKGESFTYVQYSGAKPVASYDIAIVDGPSPDLLRPLEVIYEWTGKGFEAGLSVTSNAPYYYMNTGAHSGEVALIQAGIIVAPMVIGTTGGFVIGLFACIPEAIRETGRIFVSKREVLISFSTYEYDNLNRLSHMRTFHPSDPPLEVVTTEFLYTGEELVPSETNVLSHPEGKIRTLE